MGSSGEVMSETRLAEIRQTLDILLAEPRSSTEFLAAELLAEVARLRAILAHAWTDAIKHDSGCGCYTCELAREAITRDDAERILWPVE